MKAIKIDVINKTITEINLKKGIKPIYKETGWDLFEIVLLKQDKDNPSNYREDLYVDEEGLLKESIGEFVMDGYRFTGHGLIIGCQIDTGDSCDCISTVQDIYKRVRFINNKN